MNQPAVSIIVVSFNTREMTLACLESVREQTSVSHEVVVVDNASSDGSAEAIASRFPEVRLISMDENLGFAGANNLAARHSSGRHLLLLNPDTLILERAIDRLVEFAEAHGDAGIWGGRTVFEDGRLNPTSCWARPTLWSMLCRGVGLSSVFRHHRLFDSESYGPWQRDTVRQVDIVTGCFMLIERGLWERLGGFDESFFMYGEEADFCARASRVGARPMVTPDACIVHYGGASERVRADKMVRLLAARMTLVRRHWRPLTRTLAERLLMLWPFSRQLAARLHLTPTRDWIDIWNRRSEWRSGYPSRDGDQSTLQPH